MKKPNFLFFIFLCVTTSFSVWAASFKSVEVIKISDDFRSVILNIGSSENIGENDYGRIYEFDGYEANIVAEVEAVKSNNTYSFWLVRKIHPKKKLDLEKRYQFEFVSSSLRNRNPEIIKYKNSVEAKNRKSHSGNHSDYIPEDLIFEEELFGEGDKVINTKSTKRHSIELESKTKYVGKQKEFVDSYDKELEIVRPESLEQLVDLEDLQKEEREKQFKKQLDGFVYDFNKSNKGLAYGLDVAPDDPKTHNYSRKMSIPNTRDEMIIEDELNSVIDQKAVTRIQKEGPMWSKGMRQHEIRKYLIDSGLAKEKIMRERALHELYDNEIFLKYNTSLNTYANTADPNFQGNNFSFTIGYEYLLARTSSFFKNFTVAGHLETGVNFVDLSTTNARVQYTMYGATVNWYFWNKPYSVNKYMLYVGTGFEKGGGNLQTGQFEEQYSYDLTAVPVNVGVKYRFRGGDEKGSMKTKLGLGVFFNYGYRYTEYSTDEFIQEFFDPNVVTREDRLSIGMSAYFLGERMKFSTLFVLIFMSLNLFALEIDEKLTARILSISQTRKTILLNRGLEDGLAVGDHAKLFLTTGVIARGVVIKTSPTRSIWSVYRVVEPETLTVDKSINIKISTPVKLTEDPSKSVYARTYSNAGMDSIAIPLAEGANDMPGGDLNSQDQADLASMNGGPTPTSSVPNSSSGMGMNEGSVFSELSGINLNRNLEAFGMLHFNSLSTTATDGATGNELSGSNSRIDFSIGIEKYFSQTKGFLKDVSIFGLLHSGKQDVTYISGIQASTAVTEYGVGASYHFLAHPLSYSRMIGYVTAAFGVGSTEDTLTDNNTNSSSEPLSGSSNFLSFGGGIKYFVKNGWGGRLLVDYYQRGEDYAFEGSEDSSTKVVAGPRILLGLGYRW